MFSRKGNGSDIGSRILLLIKVYSAHEYSKKLSKRIGDAHARARSETIIESVALNYGSTPFWIVRTEDCYSISDKWGDVVKSIFDSIEKGIMPTTVAGCLNGDGVSTPHKSKRIDGEYIDSSTKRNSARIRKIVTSRKVLGYTNLTHHGSDIKIYPLNVSEEQFNRVSAIVSDRKTKVPSGKQSSLFLFSSFTFCFECGEKMHAFAPRQRKNGNPEIRMKCGSRDKLTKESHKCENGFPNEKFDIPFLNMIVDKLAVSDFVVARKDTGEELGLLQSELLVVE